MSLWPSAKRVENGIKRGNGMSRIINSNKVIIIMLLTVIVLLIGGYKVHAEDTGKNLEEYEWENLSVEDGYRIEQIQEVMPYVRVFYYPKDYPESKEKIYGRLDNKKLITIENRTWKESEYGINYYFLIDNSKSVNQNDFENIKNQLKSFPDYMNEKDSLTIYIVGDDAILTDVVGLTRNDRDKIGKVIDEIDRVGDETHLYKAISTSVNEITRNTRKEYGESGDIESILGTSRNVIIAVSDGVNESERGTGYEEAKKLLISKNIPLYIIEQKYFDGSTWAARTDIESIVRESGGTIFSTEDTADTDEIIKELSEYLNNCVVATFISNNNHADEKELPFSLGYIFGDEYFSFESKMVVANRYMKDETAPEIKAKPRKTGDNIIEIEYSETVKNAANASNYVITDVYGNAIGILSVE